MFQSKSITALGQGIVAFLAAIIFPLAGLALLEPALSIDESDREQSAYYMPICFFILGGIAVIIAIWRFAVAHKFSNLSEPGGDNPELESYTEQAEKDEAKLEADLDRQTRKYTE